MSLSAVFHSQEWTHEPMQRLAAAILALAVEDLNSIKHRPDAYRFLHSDEAELCAGVLGMDYFEMYRRVRPLLKQQPTRASSND